MGRQQRGQLRGIADVPKSSLNHRRLPCSARALPRALLELVPAATRRDLRQRDATPLGCSQSGEPMRIITFERDRP